MKVSKFTEFITEAALKDRAIVSQLAEIKALKEKLKELTAETKRIESSLKEFDAEIKPYFDAMKVLNDKLGLTEQYVVKITKYGGTRTDVTWKSVVDSALERVDEAARAIIGECIEANKKLTEVKHSFEIEDVNESKAFDKFKAIVSKITTKLKNLFSSKMSKIDAANAKLKALIEKVNESADLGNSFSSKLSTIDHTLGQMSNLINQVLQSKGMMSTEPIEEAILMEENLKLVIENLLNIVSENEKVVALNDREIGALSAKIQ